MVTQFEVDCRHAKVYLVILEQENKTYEAGGESALGALDDFDKNWEQIVKAQAWAVDQANPNSAETQGIVRRMVEQIHAWTVRRTHLTPAAKAEETEETRVSRELCSRFSAVGAALLALRHPRDRIQWSEAALKAARYLSDKPLECMHLNQIGLSNTELGDYDEAGKFYQQVIAIAGSHPEAHHYEGRAYINWALTRARTGEYNDAINDCNKAIRIAQQHNDLRDEGKAQNILGEIHLSQGKFEEASKQFDKALELAEQIDDFRSQANTLGSLGNVYLERSSYFFSNLEKAVDYYERALAIYGRLGDQRGEMNALGMLGEARRSQREFEQAQTHFDQALSIAETLNSKYHQAHLHY